MKKYINFDNGFIRLKKVELSWDLKNWVFGIGFDFGSEYVVFVQVLFLTIIITK